MIATNQNSLILTTSIISVYSTSASFVNKHKKDTKAYTKDQLIEMMNYLIDNCYVTCGDSLFRQKIGIPMGTDCAPFLANLFLYSYEHEWMMKMKKTNPQLARQFNRSARYIDDLLTINNDGLMKKYMKDNLLSWSSNMRTVKMTRVHHT